MENELHLHKAAGVYNKTQIHRETFPRADIVMDTRVVRDTYIFEPGELVHLRICSHYTLEVHVVALFDVNRIQRFTHP